MRKRIKHLRLLLLCFMLLAFAGRTHAQDTTPVQMYNKLADIFIKMTDLAIDMSRQYQEKFPVRDWAAIKPSRVMLEDYCANNIPVLIAMKDAGGSYELRQALIKLFRSELVLAMVYTNFDEFDENTTADIANAKKHSRDDFYTGNIEPQLSVVQQAWGAFIKSNGIK